MIADEVLAAGFLIMGTSSRRPAVTSKNDKHVGCFLEESRTAGCGFAPQRMLR